MEEYTTLEMLKKITENEIYQSDDIQVKYIGDVLCYKNMNTQKQTTMVFTKEIIDNWKWKKVNNETTWQKAIEEHIRNNKTIEFFGSNGYEFINKIYKPHDDIRL